jgi:hypothetical protein
MRAIARLALFSAGGQVGRGALGQRCPCAGGQVGLSERFDAAKTNV